MNEGAVATPSQAAKVEWDEIKDGTPEKFETAIAGLFDLAQENVIMLTDFYAPFYNRPKVKESIENAANRVQTFRVVLDSHVDVPRLREDVAWLFENKKIEIEKSDAPVPHWMMMDHKHFRFEKPHPPNEPGKSNLIVRNANLDQGLAPLVSGAINFIRETWEDSDPVESAATKS